jgi:iron complex transport system substrate-binding protein
VKKLGLIALAILPLLLTACGTSQEYKSQTITEKDVSAISIDSSAQFSVSRVVVLANGVAEIMNSLNAKSILVGRDISSTESELKDIPIVTSGHQVLSEKVIALKPDLVIIDASTGPKSALDQIKSAGIKIVQTPESWTLADIPIKVAAVATAIGSPQQGNQLNAAFTSQLKTSKIPSNPRIAFLYLRGTSSVYLIGGKGSGADSLISAIGATDIGAQSLPNPFNTMTAESLATLNPDVIIVMSKGLQSVGGISGLLKLPGVAQTQAGKNQAVIDVDDSLLLSFGPRTPALVQALADAVTAVTK